MNQALCTLAVGMLLGYALARGRSRRPADDATDDSVRTLSGDAAGAEAGGASSAPGPGPGALYPGGTAAASPAR